MNKHVFLPRDFLSAESGHAGVLSGHLVQVDPCVPPGSPQPFCWPLYSMLGLPRGPSENANRCCFSSALRPLRTKCLALDLPFSSNSEASLASSTFPGSLCFLLPKAVRADHLLEGPTQAAPCSLPTPLDAYNTRPLVKVGPGALPFNVLRIKQDSSWKFCTI